MMPQRIGDYEILEKIGAGGMGVVYKAQSPNEIVALKVVSPEISQDQKFAQRFLREMQLVSTLDDENIVRCLDFGVDVRNNVYFMALEFVDGETLDDYLQRQGRVALLDALYIVYKVSLGLQHAWEKGIIHRDIKPDNILLDVNGNIKISDFGLAKCLAHQGGLTKAGTMLGTPLYIAPEQAFEGEEEVDTRSDIYSLGISLFHMLAGQPPFLGKNAMMVLHSHKNQPLPDLEKFCPGIPKEIISMVQKMTEKNPSNRFSQPKELAKAIGYLKDLPEIQGYSHPESIPPEEPSPFSATSSVTKLIPHKVFAAAQHLVQRGLIQEEEIEKILSQEYIETVDQMAKLLLQKNLVEEGALQKALESISKETRRYEPLPPTRPKCENCGRELDQEWIVCPYCSTVIPRSVLGIPQELKIFIGERDEKALRELKAFFLNIYPHAKIISALGGIQALEIIQSEKPDVAFLHCLLPGKNGVEICQILRNHPEYSYLPVFILTDAYVPLLKVKSYQAGAKDFLGKPLDQGEIKIKMDQLFNLFSTPLPVAPSETISLSQSQVMAGKLYVISLPELIQSLYRSRETGVLTVSYQDFNGHIYFQKGKVINADCGDLKAEDAFLEILHWTGGSFQFRHKVSPVEEVFHVDTMALLMEGMRILDEEEKESQPEKIK